MTKTSTIENQITRQWLPHVTVASLVVKDDQYLVVKESPDGKTVINQPAGHVEKNETLVQAVIRETLEETGWHIEPQALVGMYYYTTPKDITYLRFTFIAKAVSHDPDQPLDTVIEDACWMSKQQLLDASELWRGPVVMQCIDDFERGQRFPLEAIKHGFVDA